MKVPELLKRLALGELSNLSLGSDGVIPEGKIPRIIICINDGLLRLHSKFLLKEKSLVIEMREGVTNYHLLKKFAQTQYDENNPPELWNLPYIMDLAKEPFEEDVIKVLSVYSSVGDKLPINDLEKCNSVFLPQPLIIQVPSPVRDAMLGVEYQARHKIIPETEYEDVDVEIPECLESALRYFIASEVYSQINTQESSMKGQEYFMKYELVCQDVINMDLVNTAVSTTNTRFEKRGWR